MVDRNEPEESPNEPVEKGSRALRALSKRKGLTGGRTEQQRAIEKNAPLFLDHPDVQSLQASDGLSPTEAVVAVLTKTIDDAFTEDPIEDADRRNEPLPVRHLNPDGLALRYGLGLEGTGNKPERLEKAKADLQVRGQELEESSLETRLNQYLWTRLAEHLYPSPQTASPTTEERVPESIRTTPTAAQQAPNGDAAAETDGDEPDDSDRSRRKWRAAAIFAGLFSLGLLLALVWSLARDTAQPTTAPATTPSPESTAEQSSETTAPPTQTEENEAAADESPQNGDPEDSQRSADTSSVGEGSEGPVAGGEVSEGEVSEGEASEGEVSEGEANASDSADPSTAGGAADAPAPEPEPVQLLNLKPVEGSLFEANGRFFVDSRTLGGSDTGQILVASVDRATIHQRAEVAYKLDGQYKSFRVQVAYSPDSAPNSPVTVTATVDGGIPLFSKTYSLFDAREEATTYDITDRVRLRIQVDNQDRSLCPSEVDFGCQVLFLVAELTPVS